ARPWPDHQVGPPPAHAWGAEGAVVYGQRLVVAEVGLMDRTGIALPEEDKQHHDIGLLDELELLEPLPAEHHIHRGAARCIGGQIDLLRLMEAAGVLDETLSRVQSADEPRSNLAPARWLGVVQAERCGQRTPAILVTLE